MRVTKRLPNRDAPDVVRITMGMSQGEAFDFVIYLRLAANTLPEIETDAKDFLRNVADGVKNAS